MKILILILIFGMIHCSPRRKPRDVVDKAESCQPTDPSCYVGPPPLDPLVDPPVDPPSGGEEDKEAKKIDIFMVTSASETLPWN